jgi:hypothetical protein
MAPNNKETPPRTIGKNLGPRRSTMLGSFMEKEKYKYNAAIININTLTINSRRGFTKMFTSFLPRKIMFNYFF